VHNHTVNTRIKDIKVKNVKICTRKNRKIRGKKSFLDEKFLKHLLIKATIFYRIWLFVLLIKYFGFSEKEITLLRLQNGRALQIDVFNDNLFALLLILTISNTSILKGQ
jgi:hypothetical protein